MSVNGGSTARRGPPNILTGSGSRHLVKGEMMAVKELTPRMNPHCSRCGSADLKIKHQRPGVKVWRCQACKKEMVVTNKDDVLIKL